MQLTVSEEIFEKFPDTRIGIVVAADIENRGVNEEVSKLLGEIQAATKEKFDLNTLIENPSIATWRNIYNDFGSKPRDYRSSIEALIRSVLNGRGIRHINKLVDIYNYISLKYSIPVGGEDLDKVEGNLHLKFADGDEKFIPLGSGVEDNPYKGEVIYCDDSGNALCRRWNWRESDKTKLTEETKNAIIVVEGFDERVQAAAEELAEVIGKFSRVIETFIVDKNTNHIEW